MNDFGYMHIYFFVTTIAVIVVTILIGVILFYLIKVFKDIKYISGKAKVQADLISEDIHELRSHIKAGTANIRHFADFIAKIFKGDKRKHKSNN